MGVLGFNWMTMGMACLTSMTFALHPHKGLVTPNGCEIIQETNTEVSPSSSNSAIHVVIALLSVVTAAIILKIKSDNSTGVEKQFNLFLKKRND